MQSYILSLSFPQYSVSSGFVTIPNGTSPDMVSVISVDLAPMDIGLQNKLLGDHLVGVSVRVGSMMLESQFQVVKSPTCLSINVTITGGYVKCLIKGISRNIRENQGQSRIGPSTPPKAGLRTGE